MYKPLILYVDIDNHQMVRVGKSMAWTLLDRAKNELGSRAIEMGGRVSTVYSSRDLTWPLGSEETRIAIVVEFDAREDSWDA